PLDEILQNYSPHSPITASRHSYKTGTTRKFECRWMWISALAENQTLEPLDGHDGLLVYSFGNQKNIQNLPKVCANGCPLLIAYAPHENQIKELALEAAAIKAVLLESPELERDGVAKKEARFRLQAAEDHLREYVDQIYSPTSPDVTWHVGSEIKQITSYRALSTIVSDMCDRAYASCPPIRNEMINSNYLSASAARARRELAEAMVEHEEEEQLGLKGFGPEVAVYRSLFKLVGLHADIGGKWKFVKPDNQKNPELVALWRLLDEILIDSENSTTGVSVGSLVERLKQTPFGMREGPITLYLCHYLIVNSDDIALYQEGAYKPYFGSAEIALMIKRPELFSVRYYSNTGLGREVVQAYLQVLNTDAIYLKDGVRNPSLLQIVTPLIQFMEGLPEYSRFTRSVSLSAQRLRGVVLNAREPIKLLFEEIPE
ncbi:MAG TPA: hypothetical protein PK712_08995, partial [Rectinema sp.]|nr:hypothetical protein [Rectinema sp.]